MRWLGRTVLILLAIVAVLAPALWIGRDVVPPRVARWAINRAAGVEVIDELSFRVDGLSSSHVTLIDLQVNADAALTAERVRLEFQPRELLDGRLRTVVVTGAAVEAGIRPDGSVTFGSLDPAIASFASPSEPEAAVAAPIVRLVLQNAAIRLRDGIEGVARLQGTLAPAASGIAASLSWRIDAETTDRAPLPRGVAIAAEGHATLEGDGGSTRLSLTLADGRVARQALEVDGLQGSASLVLQPVGGPVLTAELSAARLAAGSAMLPEPSLHLRYEPSGLTATARLGDGSDPEVEVAVAADEASPEGRRPFRLDARADLARLDALLAAWTARPPLALQGGATAELAGSLPSLGADPAAVWAGAIASGGVNLLLADAELPALGRAHGSARLAVAMAAGRLAVETAEPLTVESMPPTPDGDDGSALPAGPLTLTVGAVSEPFRLLLQTPFEEAQAELTGPATLLTGDGGNAQVQGRVIVRETAAGWALQRVVDTSISAAGFSRAGVVVEQLQAEVADLSVGPSGPEGEFEASLRMSVPERGVTGATLSAAGRVTTAEAGIQVVLSRSGRLTIDRLAPAVPLAPIERFTAQIAVSERPVLTLPADGGPVALRLPLDLPAFALASAEPDRWRIDLDPVRVVVETALEPAGSGQLRARLSNAAATVHPVGVTLQGLAADLRMALDDGGARLQRIDVRARRVADAAQQLARFTPLSLEGFARGAPTTRSPDRLAFRATLRGADGAFVLDADGHHVPSGGRGEAKLTLFPIRFVPGGLQPADLSPAAAAMFRGASGQISLGGRVRWPGEAVPPDDPLTLTLADIGFTGSLGTVTGLGGAIAVTHVDPPATAPGQQLSATAVDFGVPIVAPRVRFRLEPEQLLRLESVEARFAGGQVTAADIAIPLDVDRPIPVVLTVEGVDAAKLAEVVDLDGLSATGTLSGWLPLLWEPDTGLAIRQARLTAGGQGGSIRYQPEDGAPALQDGGEQVSLLLRAVRNFVYESFEVEADGRPGEPFDVKLRLRGANPDLYDGYPIALNVTLTGALDELFGNLRRSLGLTDVIRRRLEASSGGG